MARLQRFIYTDGVSELPIVASSKKHADQIIAIENSNTYARWEFTGKIEHTDIECDVEGLEQSQMVTAIKKRDHRWPRLS